MEAAVCLVELEEQPMDIDLSPTGPMLAAGLITGKLELFSYDFQGKECFTNKRCHSVQVQPEGQSCRAVRFDPTGAIVYCGGADGSIAAYDVATGAAGARVGSAHSAVISALSRLGEADPSLMCSGDELGGVALWDTRVGKKIMSYSAHTDTINSMTVQSRERCLLVASGDGTLSVHDLRTRKVRARSETDADDEYLSVAVAKNGNKVVCGTQSGALNIFSWGFFNDCSDRFMGHPESVDALVVYDDATLISGSSDGGLRLLQLLPNKLLGVIGEHSAGLPVERLALASDRRVLASASHDATVKLWDITYLGEDDSDNGAEAEEGADAGGQQDVTAEKGGAAGSDDGDEASAGSSEDGEGEDDDEDASGDEGEAGVSGEGEEEAEEGDEGGATGSAKVPKGKKAPQKSEPAAGSGGEPSAPSGSGRAAAGGVAVGRRRGALAEALAAKGKGGGAGSDSDDDSDEGDDRKPKKAKREKTRWTTGREQNMRKAGRGPGGGRGNGGNFFADML